MPRGIRVNSIAPGPMDTPFFYGQETPEAVAYHKSNALGGRLTDIKDIAPLVDYLVTDKWITGQILFCKPVRIGEANEQRMAVTPPAKHVLDNEDSDTLSRRLGGTVSNSSIAEHGEYSWTFTKDCHGALMGCRRPGQLQYEPGTARTTRAVPYHQVLGYRITDRTILRTAHSSFTHSPSHPPLTMSRDPPPGSRYYRDSDSEPEREQKPNPTQASARPVMCRHEEYEHVEFADYGPVPGETVTSSSTPTPRYPVTTTYAAASIYVSAPSYAEQPIYADQQMYAERPTYASAPIYARASTCANSVCAEKTHLPLPSTSPKLRRSRLSRSVRAMFWVVGLVTLAAYASGLGPFRPLAFPVRCDLTKELGADLPLRASVDPLPREFVEKCNNLLKVPKGTFSERLKKLGAKLGQHVYVMEPGPTALYYVGAFGPGSWSASERPFLLAVNSTGQLSILTPRFEEARARLKGLPEEVESTWVPWDEHQSPYVVLSAHFENPAWIVDGNVRAFVTYGLQRHGKPEDAKDAEKVLRDVQSIRERKDGREIELLRCANQFTLHAIRCTRARMQLGITEGQTRKILYEEMKALGLQDYGALVLFGGELNGCEAWLTAQRMQRFRTVREQRHGSGRRTSR